MRICSPAPPASRITAGCTADCPGLHPTRVSVTVTQYYNNGISNYKYAHHTIPPQLQLRPGDPGPLHLEPRAQHHRLRKTGFNLNGSYGSSGFDNRHQVAADVFWNQPLQSRQQGCEQFDQRLDSRRKDVPLQRRPFNVTDSKIPTSVNTSGVLTLIADLVVPSAMGMSCNASNSIGQACLPKTDFATYPGSGVATALQTDWGNISLKKLRGPGYFDL